MTLVLLRDLLRPLLQHFVSSWPVLTQKRGMRRTAGRKSELVQYGEPNMRLTELFLIADDLRTHHWEEHVLPEEVLRHELSEVAKVSWKIQTGET